MTYITTPDRVRNRLGYSDPTLTDEALLEFIGDAQAYISQVTRTTFTVANPLYELARSVCTDLAAVHAIIRPAGGVIEGLDYTIDEITIRKSKQMEARLRTASQFRINVRDGLAAMQEDDTDIPVSNTGVWG